MKKYIASAVGYLLVVLSAFPVHAGTLTHTDYTAGTVITASGQNANENAIFNEFNGNIESVNIKSGTIASDRLASTIQTILSTVSKYRRPNLLYASGTTVGIETGTVTGVSGDVSIFFPDGAFYTTNNSAYTTLDLSRVAVLTGSKQSGLRTGTVANNTWYAVYAVKAQDASVSITVADTVLPYMANYATLNSNFGSNSWIYLGLIRYGDSQSVANAILAFVQSGPVTLFTNTETGQNLPGSGMSLNSSGAAATLTYTYSAGTGSGSIPNNISMAYYQAGGSGLTSGSYKFQNSGGNRNWMYPVGDTPTQASYWCPASEGVKIANTAGASPAMDIRLAGFRDNALGIGANPLF